MRFTAKSLTTKFYTKKLCWSNIFTKAQIFSFVAPKLFDKTLPKSQNINIGENIK
jgi:hypothetical protein